MNRKNMVKALNKKLKEIVSHLEDQNIEVRNIDLSVLDKAVSLVDDIVRYLNRSLCTDNYKFIYRFVFPLNTGKVVTSVVNLSISNKKFTHTFHHIAYTTTSLLLSSVISADRPFAFTKGKGSLFVMVYDGNLGCPLSELNDILRKLAAKEELVLSKEYETGVGYLNPFPKSYRGLEIPFNVEIVEYIL
jgi:hypothetical protein